MICISIKDFDLRYYQIQNLGLKLKVSIIPILKTSQNLKNFDENDYESCSGRSRNPRTLVVKREVNPHFSLNLVQSVNLAFAQSKSATYLVLRYVDQIQILKSYESSSQLSMGPLDFPGSLIVLGVSVGIKFDHA